MAGSGANPDPAYNCEGNIMLSTWTDNSITLANQGDYLDQLYRVYPVCANLRRELPDESKHKIVNYFNKGNFEELLRFLLKQDVFSNKRFIYRFLET